MSNIVKLPQVTDACRTMAQEMMRAGIIQEMTDDMFEMLEPDDMEDEVEEEVAKVVQEIMGVVPVAPNNALHVQQPEVKENEDQVDAQANEMEARLAALA